jgi:hypothetical protein
MVSCFISFTSARKNPGINLIPIEFFSFIDNE